MVKPNSALYKAIYSGIQVFEMSVGDCTMMRRRSDSYLNATQILKLGGLDKGKRTKVLEREVIPKTHEKIQGGYGKYQGTWVPLDIGRELAERYEVLHLLLPLLDFDPSTWDELPEKEQMPTRTSRARINHGHPTQAQHPHLPSSQRNALTAHKSYNRNLTGFKNNEKGTNPATSAPLIPAAPSSIALNAKKKPRIQVHSTQKQQSSDHNHNNSSNIQLTSPARPTVISKKDLSNDVDDARNRDILLSIFSSTEEDLIPSFLYAAGAITGIDWDIPIDELGHTALHWSVSLGRIHTVEWLIAKGAKVFMVNSAGETPLMRGVMTTSMYDHDCFRLMLDILRESLPLVDYTGGSVLHHIIRLAQGSKMTANLGATKSSTSPSLNSHLPPASSASTIVPSPLHSALITSSSALSPHANRLLAAKSYMVHALKVITQHNELLHILNQPDNIGETPYDLARRLNCTDLCNLLKQSGCSALPTPVGQSSKHKINPLVNGLRNKTSTKGQELVTTVQQIVDSMEMEFSNKLQGKVTDILQLQQEIKDLTQQLDQVRKQQNGSSKIDAGQLKEANAKIMQLGDRLGEYAGVTDVDIGTATYTINNKGCQLPSTAISTAEYNERSSGREELLEEQIILLQSQLTEANRNTQDNNTLAQNHSQALESLAAYKRLIAVCCDLPLERVDDFIAPLTTAIENDPPGLDIARVIGFMENFHNINPDLGPSAL